MSLPTPPGTSHRDEKENRAPRFARVSWCETTQYHAITASPPRISSAKTNNSRAGPSRSILKKTEHPVLPPLDDDAKESTPEPEDPLADLHYLDHPVARICALDAPLSDLIQAYTSLAARLRNCVTGNTDADASWPLFQPLRKHRDALVKALVRDIQHVFVDPLDGEMSTTDCPSSPLREPPSTASLPSPKNSPKKKKRGMSEEQVKRARDLCGVCHAAIRLLSVVFTLPSLYSLFDEEELGYIMTQVLAIPLAKELPTPNARKTYALAIWLIQVQRLPVEVLEPAKDRITYALRRGIEGELGKEGKKGSAGDGLKAIHDLALYQPTLFVPAFTTLLSSVLSNLLGPTLVLRSQACHALGGLALAAASLPPSEAHTKMSAMVASRLMKAVDVSPMTPTKRRLDASPSKDSALVRTLRTTFQATDPKHVAQGPVWAFSVVAHLVVLLGPTIFLHTELTRTIIALFSLGMRHPKSSVRGLGCLAWRAVTWSYFRPPHVKITVETETDGDDDSATEDDVNFERRQYDDALQACYKYLLSVVDMGAGVATIGALLGQEVMDDSLLMKALHVLRNMSRKGGQTCKDAMDLACHLLRSASNSSDVGVDKEWVPRKLIAPHFFSANPGLLTAEWKHLSSAVKPLLDECPQISDIRTLSLEEVSFPGVWDGFLAVWRDGLSVLKLSVGNEEVPSEVREIWYNLLKCHAAPLLEDDDQDGLAELTRNARDVIVGILDDTSLDFALRKEEVVDEVPTSPVKGERGKGTVEPLPESRWNYAVKLFLVRDIFTLSGTIFPPYIFAELAEAVLRYLNAHEELLLGDVQYADEVRTQWSCFCAEAALACDSSVVQAFWENTLRKARRRSDWSADVRASVWQTFLGRWVEDTTGTRSWETAVVLLCVPFIEPSCWDMSTEDLDSWDTFLRSAIDAALDHGIDATALVDQIAGVIATNHSPAATSAVRVVDLLLSNIEIADARQVPTEVLEFANDTLGAAYPPAPRHKLKCMWLIRSLTRIIDGCPQELFFSTLDLLVNGLWTWMADDFNVCSEEEYSGDILPLYQTVLVALRPLTGQEKVLETFAPLLAAPFYGRKDRHTGAVDAFAEYWQATWAALPVPHSGYPEQVVQCLDAIAQERLEDQEDEAKVEDMTAICDDIPSPTLAEISKTSVITTVVDEEDSYESEEEGSVVIPSPATLARMSMSMHRSADSSGRTSPVIALILCPSTPKTGPCDGTELRTTPKHPHKSAVQDGDTSVLDAVSPPFSSPLDSSPTHPPTTPKRSSAKASRNKENMSPTPHVTSVSERLAVRSPLLLESILGKRSRNEDAEDAAKLDEKTLKKSRLEASPLVPSMLTNIHVHMVTHDSSNALKQPVPTASAPEPSTSDAKKASEREDDAKSVSFEVSTIETSPTPISRKRKGIFIDAVEVPTVEDVRIRRRLSLEGVSLSKDTDLETTSVEIKSTEDRQPIIRRTRSATRLLGKEADFQRLEFTPKRRKMGRARQLREEAAEMSSPFRSLRDAPQFGSDDSIMIASPSDMSDLPPSDDDPHLGQVTPHRLVSPALRRVQRMVFDQDPASDDSTMSNSPSRERVTRKMAWLNSERFAKSTLSQLPKCSTHAASFSSSALESDL